MRVTRYLGTHAEDRYIECRCQGPPLVKAEIRTRHPEHYRLVNESDGSEWRIDRYGRWKRDGASHNASYALVATTDLCLILKGWERKSGLRRRAGIDPAAVNAAAERLHEALDSASLAWAADKPEPLSLYAQERLAAEDAPHFRPDPSQILPRQEGNNPRSEG